MEVTKGPMVCDFCTAPDPQWSLPTLTFMAPATPKEDFGSVGDWAACETCRDLVVARTLAARAALVKRAMRGGRPVSPAHARLVQDGIEQLHRLFFKHWSGNVMPLRPEPLDGYTIRLSPDERATRGF